MRAELDPGACWLRHIRRAQPGEPGAVSLLRAAFVVEDLAGVNGRQGWQSAVPEVRLSDDGSLSVRFPNAAGEDGKLHRDRFALLTDPLYRIGEEWLEVYREPNDLLITATPVRWRLDRSELTIEASDPLALLRGLSSETDVWVGAAPLDVLALYASVPSLILAEDFAGWDGTNTPAGWTVTGGTAAPGDDGILLDNGVSALNHVDFDASALSDATDWIMEVRWRHASSIASDSRLRDTVGGIQTGPRHVGGAIMTFLGAGGTPNALSKPLQYAVPTSVSHRIIARGEWVYFYVDGELNAVGRRGAQNPPGLLSFDSVNGSGVLQSVRVITLESLLLDGPPDDRRLPGVPPPGGLRARYYLENTARAQAGSTTGGTTANYRHMALSPFLEPYAERLEVPRFAGANPPAWQPPGPASGEAFSARWTGAIYFDLEASDRVFSFDLFGDTIGRGRAWIGGHLVLDYSAVAGSPQVFNAALRAILGVRKGWWPVTIEYSHLTGVGGISIYDQAGAVYVAANRFAIPPHRCSPIGVVDREVRNEPHRDVFGDIAATFGYQWRLSPRSLESGEFPGRLEIAPRIGRDTAHIVTADDATDIGSEGDASDAVDGLLVDASGLATIEEGAQLSYEAFLPAATDHLVYLAGYESLAEISEDPLLRARTESLLVLRSSPAETLGARPRGTRELVDRFPLPAIPELERMRWLPGDGLRLELAELAVRDSTPRQLTLIQWTCRPDGVAPPVVSFRQRARGARAGLERIRAATYAPRRNYQGQLTTVTGTVGASPTTAGLPDGAARLALPPAGSHLIRLLVLVQTATAGVRTVQINGVNVAPALTLNRLGPHDITAWLPADAVRPDGGRLFVTLTDPTASGGTWTWTVQAIIRI